MSWSGIKKAINRAGTQVMLKAGQIEQTVDKEYEYEEKRFRAMESSSGKLQKELKHYLDTLRMVTNAQVNIGEMMASFYGEIDASKPNSSISQDYYDVVKYLNEKCVADLEEPYHHTVLNPVSRFNSYYVEINEAIKKRAHKKLDYDSMKSKVRKLVEKPTDDPLYELKLGGAQAQLSQMEKTYDELNTQLKLELPKLINLRIPFFDPSFESFVKLQLRFFNDNYAQLNKLQTKLDAKTRDDYINGNLEKRVDDVLVKMKELNITSI
ncbi:uncharacterized protein PRCAT00000875001 [Priceomyces carsonii]|uniref:uncharacterized protein n=1 Tax=Priceomyces carsonii TaxID=28549 RepID=UPI002EDA0A32|nr:unnamed protein product [Priceomyces carsonii]